MLSADDVGHRVVVRHVIRRTGPGAPGLTDVLGELVHIDAHILAIRSRDGVTHEIARSEVTAAKRIPRRRASFSEIAALELVSAAGWPAPLTGHVGEWLLRGAEGWTNRGNSALPVGDSGLPLPDAVDAVESWYREHGLPPRFSVPLPLCRRLDDLLAARGWAERVRVLVEVADLADILDAVPPAADPPPQLHTTPSPEFLDLVRGRKGSLPASAGHILTAVPEVRFAHQYSQSGALVGIARGVLSPDRRWLGLALVETVPEVRRQGVAQGMVASLARWAMAAGAEKAYLQVDAINEPAVALYRKLGFATHHTYSLRWAPDPDSR